MIILKYMFNFGKNWQDYSKKINKNNIEDSLKNLKLLLKNINLKNLTFIDIGCGSGIHSIAASKLGLAVTSVDRDKTCIKISKHNFKKFYKLKNSHIFQDDILKTKISKQYNIVYSWGVLHHTSNLKKALRNSTKLVKKNGYLVISLYKKTDYDNMWVFIKKNYNKSLGFRYLINVLFIPFFFYISRKKRSYRRGQNWYFDAIDWLGGYPYETMDPNKMKFYFPGFKMLHMSRSNPMKYKGFFGSECAEFIFKKIR